MKDQALRTARRPPEPWLLPAFFLMIFAGAMVLGPLLYLGLGWIWPIPFHRAMDRGLLISAVAVLGLTWRRISLAERWPLDPGVWKKVLFGFFLSAITAQAMIGLDLALVGFHGSGLSGDKVWERVLLAMVAAVMVPPLEETVFRGFLQVELSGLFGWRAGWIGAALIFMAAHFLKISPELDTQPVHLWSGVTAVRAAFLPLIHGDFLGGRGLNLFLIGLILGGIFLRTGSLWINGGLHGGWILTVLLFSGFTRPAEHPAAAFFSGDLLSSYLTTLVLLMLSFWLWRYCPPLPNLPENGEAAP